MVSDVLIFIIFEMMCSHPHSLLLRLYLPKVWMIHRDRLVLLRARRTTNRIGNYSRHEVQFLFYGWCSTTCIFAVHRGQSIPAADAHIMCVVYFGLFLRSRGCFSPSFLYLLGIWLVFLFDLPFLAWLLQSNDGSRDKLSPCLWFDSRELFEV
jgi:hypothetical protein